MENIYIGLVAAIGCNLDPVINYLRVSFENKDYLPVYMRLSEKYLKYGEAVELPFENAKVRMDNGDLIRKKCGEWLSKSETRSSIDVDNMPNAILALMANVDCKNYIKSKKTKRLAFIIRSFKRPEEIQMFKKIHPDNFFVISCFSDKDNRQFFMDKQQGISKEKFDELDQRDEKDEVNNKAGQNRIDAFTHGDFFIDLDRNTNDIYLQIQRIVELLFGSPFITPTFDEFAMFQAFTASLRSGDLSRQVGAVLTKGEELLTQGANDIPKFGGGLYWPELTKRFLEGPLERDQNYEYKVFNGTPKKGDTNFFEREKLASEITEDLKKMKWWDCEPEEITKKISNGLKKLTEFGRTVHAEMEAIVACARLGISCQEAVLYTTTFPCHNCARHIIAAGITKVIFIEPYPKSMAFELHRDAIVKKGNDGRGLSFQIFTGVGPRRFFDLFSINLGSGNLISRKDDKNGEAVASESEKYKIFRFADVTDSDLERELNLRTNEFVEYYCDFKKIPNFFYPAED